jgi:hypothetical protein
VVADGLAIALRGVLAAAQVELGLGWGRGPSHPRGAERGSDQPGLGGRADGRRLPLVEDPDHRVDVVDLDLAGDVGAPEAELPGCRDRVGQRVLGASPECRPAAVGGGELRSVPELDRERPLREGALDLVDQWLS